MKKGFSGIAAIPDGIPTKDAFNVLVAKFPTESGAQSTAQVVIPGSKTDPSVAQKIQALDAAIANDGAFATPQPPQTSQDGTVTLVSIPFAGEATDSQSAAAVDAITRLRDEYVPQTFGQDSGVLVGGDTAMTKDFFDISNFYTPIIILLVLGLSFILLTVVFPMWGDRSAEVTTNAALAAIVFAWAGGMVTGAVVRSFRSVGWGWGGSWSGSTKDYMHFSATGH